LDAILGASRAIARRPLDDRGRFRNNNNSIPHEKEPTMNGRPRTKASKKRRTQIKKDRREKKTLSRVMPMLSRPKKKD